MQLVCRRNGRQVDLRSVWEKRCTAFGAPLVLGNRLVLHHRVKGEEIVEYITGQRRQRSAVGDNRLRRRHRTPETGSCHETFS